MEVDLGSNGKPLLGNMPSSNKKKARAYPRLFLAEVTHEPPHIMAVR
jgi:hypothetical protein